MFNLEILPDVIGMLGVTLVLSAFGLLNMNKVTSSTMMYQMMNLIGSMLLLFSLCFHLNIASVVIEIAWMLISLVGIYRALKKRRTETVFLNNNLIIQPAKVS